LEILRVLSACCQDTECAGEGHTHGCVVWRRHITLTTIH
jgi:hypothetical protein